MQKILTEAPKALGIEPKELLMLARDTSVEGRKKLLESVSCLFSMEDLSEAERRMASEIVLNLIRQAETDLRESLSERLSINPTVPPEIMIFLANDDITVARPVLLHSPVLKDIDLTYIIAAKGRDYWRAIAERPRLSPLVADRLIATNDTGTALNLVNNKSIMLTRPSMKRLIRAALKSEELQAPLLRRPEIDSGLATDLYMCVSQALKAEIAGRFHLSLPAIDAALDSLVCELSLEAKGVHTVTSEMTALAKRFNERNDISADLMIRTLRRGQISFFLALFSERVSMTTCAVSQLIKKDGGKPFALACRFAGMMKGEFASLFLLASCIRSHDRVVDQSELAAALKYYDGLKDGDVQRIMKVWQKNPEMI